jgi:hypothetical protein
MEGLWAEVEVETIVIEKCTVLIPISDPDFGSSELLIQQANSEARRHIPSVIVKPSSTKLVKAQYNQEVRRFYPDADGAPNTNCPIEINELRDLLDGDYTTN